MPITDPINIQLPEDLYKSDITLDTVSVKSPLILSF